MKLRFLILALGLCGAWGTVFGAVSNGLRLEFPGVVGEETLVRFPVAVRLSEKIDGFTYHKYNENDIRFFTEENEEVPFEIDTWNTSGESLVWVQVPALTKSTALYIRATGNGKKVYSEMWTDYAAVWHMNSLTKLKDSTVNGYDADFYAPNPAPAGLELRLAHSGPQHEPRLGAAVRWPGSNAGYIGFTVANLYQQKLYNQSSMSVEAAVSLGASADSGSYARIFQIGDGKTATAMRAQRSNTLNSPSSNKGYGFMSTICTEKSPASINAGTPHPDPNEYKEYVAGTKFYTPGALAFHGMSYDGATLDNFTGNAAEMISLSDSKNFSGKISRDIGSNLFTIGCRQGNTQNWYDGEIDELRILAVARNANWMENCRRSMLSPDTYVSFRYVRGEVPVYNVAEGETTDVSAVNWLGNETDRIIVDGKGTLNLGANLPLTITLRGNNTLKIDDTADKSPDSNLVFDHDEASVTLDVTVRADHLFVGKPIEVLTGTSFTTRDEVRVKGIIRAGENVYTENVKVSIVGGNVYLTYGTSDAFEFDIDAGSLTIKAAGTYDLKDYDFPITKLVVNQAVTLMDYQMGNDLAGRPSPAIDLTLGDEGSVDLRLLADDNYFVGQEAILFKSVTGDRDGAIRFKWNSTEETVEAGNVAHNKLEGKIEKVGGQYVFEAISSANPTIDIKDYHCSFEIDFPKFTDDRTIITNFPVGVVFSNAIPGFNYTSVHSDSLRFVDEHGNNLPYEIENGAFNKNGRSVVWVRVPYFYKDLTITACVRLAGDVAPVFEGDRAMCPHSDSSDAEFDPTFARVRFNPDLRNLIFYAPETNDVVDVTQVDFGTVDHDLVTKRGPGLIKFGASVPNELKIEEGRAEFTADVTPDEISVSGTEYIVDASGNLILDEEGSRIPSVITITLPMGNDFADNEAALKELDLTGNAAKVTINVRPSVGLYVGQVQDVIRKLTGDASKMTVQLTNPGAVAGDLRIDTENKKVVFTCSTSEVPLITDELAAKYWCKATISFPQMEGVGEAMKNFPVAVRFNENITGFRYRTANFNETLRFVDAAGNDLPYEIDQYDEQGTTLVWVMIPYFTEGTKITAYWGLDEADKSLIAAPSVAHVGPRAPFHNYAAVWHMDVRNDKSILDSTLNGFDLTFFGSSLDGFDLSTGHIGRGVTWPKNSSGNGWAVKNGLYEKKLGLRAGLSTEIVATSSDTFKHESVLLCTTRQSNYNHGYLKVDPGTHGASRFHVAKNADVDEHIAPTDYPAESIAAWQAELTAHKPLFFGGVFNGAAHKVFNYINDQEDFHAREEIDQMPLIETLDGYDVSDVRVGSREGAVDYDFQGGLIDEVRISAKARSTAWMNQVYETFFNEAYSTMTIVRDGSITIHVEAGQTLDATGTNYDTRVVHKTGAGTVIFASAPDILDLAEGAAEFTLSDAVNLPFEIKVANATAVKGIPLAPGYSASTKFTIADGAKWMLDLKVEDLLWLDEVVPVIPLANETDAANVTITLFGSSAASQMTAEAQVSKGAVLAHITKSPRGLQKWSNYEHMMTIYFNGYTELETLENFPALVKLKDGTGSTSENVGFKYNQLKYKPTDDVFDLRFADYQGNEIPYEIDTWREGGESLIWVSVPKLSAGGRILMYWGHKAGAEALLPTDYTGEHNVWKEYDAVYHFNDLQVIDQTEKHNDLEQYKFNSRFKVVDSAVGRAVYFDGRKVKADGTLDLDSNGKIQVQKVANSGYVLNGFYEKYMLGAANHTIETISTMSSSIPGYAKLMSVTRTRKSGESWSTGHYLYRLTADDDLCGVWGAFVYSKDGPASNGQRWYSCNWTPDGVKPRTLDPDTRIPVFAGCVFDGENREYTDYTAGKYATRPMEVRTILGESTTGYDPITIGFRYEYDDQEWRDNQLDEMRFARKARSPAWMNAVNKNALQNDAFCTYTVETAHANEKPILNAAIVDVSAAGAKILIALPNAGLIDGERMGEATVYGKVWDVTAEEPVEFETLGVLQEGGHYAYSEMVFEPEHTYRSVVYATTTNGETSYNSNFVTNDFTTLSRGIVVNQSGTTGNYTDEHHARLHVATGGAAADTAVIDHPGYVEVLVVGGGGNGGNAGAKGPGAGGGAGGLFYRPAMWVEAGTYAVQAAGPTPVGGTAGESYFGLGKYHVSGGGKGMSNNATTISWAVAGGSGGGGYSQSTLNMTMGTGDQGYWGGYPASNFTTASYANWYSWAGAGGGGASRDGGIADAEEDGILGEAGEGGEGRVICITGREEFYGGGGSGGVARSDDNRAGKATFAGGGAGGDGRHINGYDGINGTGGGGGGGAWYPGKENLYPASAEGKGGTGASGIVVWRYTPIPANPEETPVVMFSEIRGDKLSANLTVPVISVGAGMGDSTEQASDIGGEHIVTRGDRVCKLVFEYGVDRFNLDHRVELTDKAYLGEHEFKVTGLLRNQAYWGHVRAIDGAGHEFVTRELPFETTDEGDDAAIDPGYPRLGDYSFVSTNGHEVVFTGKMETKGLYDVKLYLATNVNDLVCKSGEGAWNNKYEVRLDTTASTNTAYTIRANDLVPGTRYWYVIEAADANTNHEQKTSYAGMGAWYEKDHQATIPMKDRTHHQYTTFVTPNEANLSRTYHEIKDFENAEEVVPVTFEEVLKETGSLPARLELCITKVNETEYADDHAVVAWLLTTNEDGEGGPGKYSFTTNFPYGTMIKYHWRVVNTYDNKENTTDIVPITTYVGNPNLFYWVRSSSEGPGDWWDKANWHNPNANYKDMDGNPLPLNEWPLPDVDSTVIFTNMVDGAYVNITGRCDVLRVNLSIGTNKVTFAGVNEKYGHAGQASLITKFFKTSGSGSELTFDNIAAPMETIDFDWMRETYIDAGSSGSVTRERDVSAARLTVTNKAEVALRNLTFAPLAGTLKVADGAKLSVGAGELNGILNVGGGVQVEVDNATLDVGTIHLEHHDLENPSGDPRTGKACSFDFRGADAKLTIEHVIGNRYGNTTTPFVFHVPQGGFTGPVVTQKGLAGLSAFGFGFRREEVMGETGEAIVIPNRGRGAVDVQIAEDSPAYRSVRTVNPTLVKAEHGFWNEVDPYVVWWVKEYHGLAVSPRATFTQIDRNWRRTNEVYFDKENEVTGNYGPTLLKARITGTQRTVVAVEAHHGEVVHRRGVVDSLIGKYQIGDTLPQVRDATWTLERHLDSVWNDSYIREIAEEVTEESETNHELYVGIDEGLLALTAVKNMDAFSTYVDANVKVKTAWEDDEPIDICSKAKIGLSFDASGRLVVLSGDFANTAKTVTNVTDFVAKDGDVVRISVQAARNKDQKEYFKIAANGVMVAVTAPVREDTDGTVAAWCVPDALAGKVFPARTVQDNPIGMGKVGFAGTAVLRKMTVGARPPAGLERAFTHQTTLGDGTIVPIPFTYLDAVREDNTTDNKTIAQSTWGNGYKLWASYALGLDPTDPESVFWTDGRLNPENVENYLMTPQNVEAPEGSLAEIGYKLQYSADANVWETAYNLLGTNANFRINNYTSGMTGAANYVRLAATVAGATIPSVNTFGAYKVDSSREKSAIAVPWVKANKHLDDNAPIALSEYVTTGELEENDLIYVLDASGSKYLAWAIENGKWVPITVVGGTVDKTTVEKGGAASETGLPRGSAVWMQRKNPTGQGGAAKRFHLVGQVPGGELKTQVKVGPNLLANPLGTAFDFSGVTEGVVPSTTLVPGDQICVPQEDGELKLYTFENGAWGTLVKTTKKIGSLTRVTWTRKTDQNVIPIGQGFWYISAGGTPILNWKDGEKKEVK